MATATLTPHEQPPEFLTPSDVGRLAGAHPNWCKLVGEQMRIVPRRTPSGMRLYTRAQAARIAAEIQRRRQQ
jgi:hypothetical protein